MPEDILSDSVIIDLFNLNNIDSYRMASNFKKKEKIENYRYFVLQIMDINNMTYDEFNLHYLEHNANWSLQQLKTMYQTLFALWVVDGTLPLLYGDRFQYFSLVCRLRT